MRFVAASSDKASNPAGVYGLTKALMERQVCTVESDADFGAVRLGSIWAASGSVVALWSRSDSRVIEVTEPSMTRFFLPLNDAVDLLIAGAQRKLHGQVFAHRMRAYVLGDLAAAFRRQYGFSVRIVGPRDGEKLHEDLIAPSEAPYAVWHHDELLISPGRRQLGAASFSSADAQKLSTVDLERLVEQQMAGTDVRTSELRHRASD
jgi:UDP-N-acetylglucosamine 4,6-dehydratase/5-epimerase